MGITHYPFTHPHREGGCPISPLRIVLLDNGLALPYPAWVAFLHVSDYLKLPAPDETWIIDPLIPQGGLVNLYGPPKGGKSYLALQLALDIALRNPTWMGFPIKTHGLVCYLQLDTPRSLWRDRILKLQDAGVIVDGFALADRNTEGTPWPFDILSPHNGFNWLREQMDLLIPAVVIIDTLRDVHRGNENDSQYMQEVMDALVGACQPAAVVLLSHSRKANPDRGFSLVEDQRGSTAIAGKMDTILHLGGGKLSYTGRATEQGTIPLKQDPTTHLWLMDKGEEKKAAQGILAKDYASDRARARALAEELHIKEESARNLLRKVRGETPSSPLVGGLTLDPPPA